MFLQKDNINDAKIALDDGKIVGIPTETVYGLGVNPYSQEAVNRLFKIKEVEFDNETHYWSGDYDTGSVKPIHDKTLISEAEVNYAANMRILEEFPLHKQLNIIIDMLDKSEIPNTEKFTKLKDLIKVVKEETKQQKKVYEEDDAFEYTTIKEEIAKADKLKDLSNLLSDTPVFNLVDASDELRLNCTKNILHITVDGLLLLLLLLLLL